MKNIMTSCYGLTRAERIQHPQSLDIVNGILNMDTHSLKGITSSKEAGIISNNYANLLVSSLLHEASALFTPQKSGQLFTIMRHPIHTSVSLFYYLSYAKWEQFYNPEFGNMTLYEYASSSGSNSDGHAAMIDNWLVRYLSHEERGEISIWHLNFAKEMLETKFVIGLFDHLEESIFRFQYYFGWNHDNHNSSSSGGGNHTAMTKAKKTQCVCNSMKRHFNQHEHAEIVEGSDEWNLLLEKNKYDMELYEFAIDLYERQGNTIFTELLEKRETKKESGLFCE
uniref:Sulfotransferase domain-containing protein n=1 Tax=Ditylum brightwellii TaxID=49249 RepID=A0A7S2E7J6_9STRA